MQHLASFFYPCPICSPIDILLCLQDSSWCIVFSFISGIMCLLPSICYFDKNYFKFVSFHSLLRNTYLPIRFIAFLSHRPTYIKVSHYNYICVSLLFVNNPSYLLVHFLYYLIIVIRGRLIHLYYYHIGTGCAYFN